MINYDENGFKILDIKYDGSKTLYPLRAFILSLNDEKTPHSNINNWGAYADSNVVDGIYVETSQNHFGIVLGEEFNPFIYRGQNKDFPTFKASAHRYDLLKPGTIVDKCIDYVKKQEFLDLFKITPYYERCQKFKVLNCSFQFDLEAVAQHYDFVSNYLDITRDFMVALFFAYTYKDKASGNYCPITDFNEYSPTLYIANLSKIYEHYPNNLKIIGFQSLLRPHLQKAMALEINDNSDIKSLFETVELPKNAVFSNEIFHKMNEGKALFPNEFMNNTSTEILRNKELQTKYIHEFCNKEKLDYNRLLTDINKRGHIITDKEWGIPTSAWYYMNKEIDDMISYLDHRIGFRGVSEPLIKKGAIYNNNA